MARFVDSGLIEYRIPCPVCDAPTMFERDDGSGQKYLACHNNVRETSYPRAWHECVGRRDLPTHVILERLGAAMLPGFDLKNDEKERTP